ncbi:phosphatidylglycerophosphatase A family protein [Haliangium sp.]|uniref:phosphatidylglycerophosphatase A family protein n=1 Tax=Haliangium sp. TaxID=2663208 RepID=UPI003D12B3F4
MRNYLHIDSFAKFLATAGGAGYAPVAPGTFGTAVAVPLVWLTGGWSWWAFLVLTAAVTVVGVWAAERADRSWGTHDSGRIVIDEVAGYMVTMMAVARADWLLLGLGFAVFRVLDITKPPPVRAIDRKLGGGLGVVLDDVAAGVLGCAVMWALVETGAVAGLHELLGA